MTTSSAYKDITFLLAGPKGDPGATGNPGPPGDAGATGARGPALRGPRDWTACEVRTHFCSGADGEDYLDVVLYNGNYYVCTKSHAKTQINAPGGSYSETNGLWRLGDKLELIATNILLSNYAVIKNLGVESIEMRDASGNALLVAKDGVVTCATGTFNNIDVQSGKVGGFNIDGMVLTNAGLNNDAAVLCKHATYGVTAAIGANVTPGTGYRAVALFENHDTSNGVTTSLPNYAIRASARNTINNIALALDGGAVQGFAMRNVIVGATATGGAIGREDYNIVATNNNQCQLTLPRMELYDDGHVIRIKRLGNGAIGVRMQACYTYNGSASRLTTPVLRTATGGYVVGASTHVVGSAVGDSIELVWCRDIVTNYNGATYYGAWVEYKLS
jgi:hypothetical protein